MALKWLLKFQTHLTHISFFIFSIILLLFSFFSVYFSLPWAHWSASNSKKWIKQNKNQLIGKSRFSSSFTLRAGSLYWIVHNRCITNGHFHGYKSKITWICSYSSGWNSKVLAFYEVWKFLLYNIVSSLILLDFTQFLLVLKTCSSMGH